MSTLLVTGHRYYEDYEAFSRAMWAWCMKNGYPHEIVHGGAIGTDSMAQRWADAHEVEVTPFNADWDRWGDAAGPKRNREMVKVATHVIAFPQPGGRGTQNCVRHANNANLPIEIHWVKR